jgi:hypothetical protein
MKTLILWGVILLSAAPSLATDEAATLGLDKTYPLQGESVQIMISHATYPALEKVRIKATYRPSSTVEEIEELPAPDSDGKVNWMPKHSGIVVLSAAAPALGDIPEVKLSKNLSVRYNGFPPLGLAMFLLAATTLFGGLILVLSRLKGQQPV